MTVGAECEQLVDRRQLRPAGRERAEMAHLERDVGSAAVLAAVLCALEYPPAWALPWSALDAAVSGAEAFMDGRVGAAGDAVDGSGSWHGSMMHGRNGPAPSSYTRR
jgi:hypothetical protein